MTLVGGPLAVEEGMMRGEVTAGAITGFGSALVVGLMMEEIHLGTGGALSGLATVAALLPPMPPEAAAVVGLGYCVIIGGVFGWLHRGEWLGRLSALFRAGVYGLSWCLVTTLLVGPVLRRMLPFSASAVELAWRVLPAALVGHAVYGILLGIGFSMMTYRVLGHGGFADALPRPKRHAA
jgi:hypothetical protein